MRVGKNVKVVQSEMAMILQGAPSALVIFIGIIKHWNLFPDNLFKSIKFNTDSFFN